MTARARVAAAAPELLRPPIAPCELMPRGGAGLVVIGGGRYDLSYHGELPGAGEPRIDGYRLSKPDGTCYDLPAGVESCECLGYLRWARCKHTHALRRLKANGEIV